MLRVWCRMPGTSEATKDSPSPTPMTTGGPKRAATILSGSAAERTPSAKAPVRRLTARRTAASSGIGCAGGLRVLLHLLDEVGDDLGVGFGDELVALRGEFALQIEIVLDDAVVDDDDAAGAVAMGMGILFRGAAMRGPAGVADAEGAVERMLAQNLFQVGELARRAAHLERGAGWAAHGDARRVVAAVFQAPQPLDDDRNYFLWTDITDNAAHAAILSDLSDSVLLIFFFAPRVSLRRRSAAKYSREWSCNRNL